MSSKVTLLTRRGFSLMEIIVVLTLVSSAIVVAIPAYRTYMRKSYVSRVVNKLDSLRTELSENYTANGSWPSSFNGATAGSTVADSTFNFAPNFRYNNSGAKAWIGYQLNSGMGSGWVFMMLKYSRDAFDVRCGSLNTTCTLGACNSTAFYPTGCNELTLNATFTLE